MFSEVDVGGTFDQLHRGHKALIVKALEIGRHVTIGLCSDEFAAKMDKPHITASYSERLKDLQAFLASLGASKKTQIIPLNDTFGTAVSDRTLEALVVSDETKKTALEINRRRAIAGLPALEIVTINMIPSENCAPISTTRIRAGEIDREGRLLRKPDRA